MKKGCMLLIFSRISVDSTSRSLMTLWVSKYLEVGRTGISLTARPPHPIPPNSASEKYSASYHPPDAWNDCRNSAGSCMLELISESLSGLLVDVGWMLEKNEQNRCQKVEVERARHCTMRI